MAVATLLALTAAVLHAGWNFLVKTSADRFLALWGQFVVGGVIGAVGLAGLWLVTGDGANVAALPWAALSAGMHLPYVLLLASAYDHGDFSLVYPVGRGAGALGAAIGGTVLLDDRLSVPGWIAVVVVAVGLASFVPRGSASLRSKGLRSAGLLAVVIATYTIVDAQGARRSSGIGYVLTIYVGAVVVISTYGLARGRGGELRALMRSGSDRRSLVLAGSASVVTYGLVLAAVRHAPVGYVAALRESSVVLAAFVGWRLLGEDLGRARLASSAVVAAGLVMLVAFR